MCQEIARRRVCASQICVDYCLLKQNDDDKDDEEGEGDEDDEEEEDNHLREFQEVEYRNADYNEGMKRVKQCSNGFSSKTSVPAREKKMLMIYTNSLALILTVIYIYFFGASYDSFVVCDNKFRPTDNLIERSEYSKLDYDSNLGK